MHPPLLPGGKLHPDFEEIRAVTPLSVAPRGVPEQVGSIQGERKSVWFGHGRALVWSGPGQPRVPGPPLADAPSGAWGPAAAQSAATAPAAGTSAAPTPCTQGHDLGAWHGITYPPPRFDKKAAGEWFGPCPLPGGDGDTAPSEPCVHPPYIEPPGNVHLTGRRHREPLTTL